MPRPTATGSITAPGDFQHTGEIKRSDSLPPFHVFRYLRLSGGLYLHGKNRARLHEVQPL